MSNNDLELTTKCVAPLQSLSCEHMQKVPVMYHHVVLHVFLLILFCCVY